MSRRYNQANFLSIDHLEYKSHCGGAQVVWGVFLFLFFWMRREAWCNENASADA